MGQFDSAILDAVFAGSLEVGLCLFDAGGVIVRANPTWVHNAGLLNRREVSERELVGRTLRDVLPMLPDEVFATHEEVRRTKVGRRLPPAELAPDHWYQCHTVPVDLPDGVGVLMSVINHSESARARRALTESEARFRAVLEGMTEGCTLLSHDLRYLYLNPAAVRQSRKGAGELLGRNASDVLHDVRLGEQFATAFASARCGTPGRFESELKFEDGASGWFEFTLQHHPEGLLVLSHDITDRKRAEAEVLGREAALREAQRIARLGSWEIDFQSGSRVWSNETYEIFEHDPKLGPLPVEEIEARFPSADWPRAFSALRDALTERAPFEVVIRARAKDGAARTFVAKGEPRRNESGALTRVRGTIQDITDRVRVEESFRAVSDKLQAILDASPVAIVAVDPDGRVTQWNRAATQTFGWTEPEVLGEPNPVVGEEQQAEFHALIDRARGGELVRDVATIRRTKDGQMIPVSVSSGVLRGDDGSYQGTVAVLIDLSRERRLREALIESERRFAAAFDASPIAKVLVRLSDRLVVEANRAYTELAGCDREEILGRSAQSLPIFPFPEASDPVWAKLVDEEHVAEHSFAFSTKDQKPGLGLASVERLYLGDGDYALVLMQDVTESAQSRRALEESETRFRQLADTIAEVFWLTDVDKGKVIYVSPAYELIWGRSCKALEANPREWVDAIHPDDRARILDAAMTKQGAGTYDEEYRIVRPDGSVRWIRDRGYPVKDASGRVVRVAGSAIDVTARRDLEDQLRQTQKMESIGQLAGGVAHDFNNLLTVIASSCHALADIVPPGDGSEILSEIETATDRATALTRQLLAFSRREVIAPRVLELGTLVTDTEKMLRRLLGEDVLLELSLTRESTKVLVDPGSLAQVLMNLAVNARDAMPRGGTLSIATEVIELDATFVQGHPQLSPGRHVALSLTDTGVGMAPEVLSRIFEPFFTTKGVGQGTGLGLSVVHGIIVQSGGALEVASTVGRGSRFRIYLPLREAQRSASLAAPKPAPAQGTETILVVEDEDGIRRIVVRALTKAGYTVLDARDGATAIAVADAFAGPIHLLMTDVVMPRMDGRALSEALHAKRPDMRVLYTSGYTADAVVRYGIRHAEVAFLGKPYAPQALRQKVRSVLDAPLPR